MLLLFVRRVLSALRQSLAVLAGEWGFVGDIVEDHSLRSPRAGWNVLKWLHVLLPPVALLGL